MSTDKNMTGLQILMATSNPHRIDYFSRKLAERGIRLLAPANLGLSAEAEETGQSPADNAQLKIRSLLKAAATGTIEMLPIFAMDEGLYLDGVPDELQPGLFVRRLNGQRMNDEEMIAHYLGLVDRFGKRGELHGYFLKGICVGMPADSGRCFYTFEMKARRVFTAERSEKVTEGYPLASIQKIPMFDKFKSELNEEEERQVVDVENEPILDFIERTLKFYFL
ncbi:MAG: hypothetical protein J6P72_09035 [Firmicutes bacterium]|nr:hypothetical protein [Bacillota bacterium]